MAQPKLPLRIKVDIRDRFEAPHSTVQKALSALESIVGLKTSCNIEWDLLYQTLEDKIEDKSTFVPSLAEVVVAWCDVLSTRLEDERFAAWTENIVDRLEAAGAIKLRIQVSDDSRPSTTWSSERSVFILSVPGTSNLRPEQVSSRFEADFASLVVDRSLTASLESLATKPKDDDWAEVDETGEASSLTTELANLSLDTEPDRIPSVATLPPLANLLNKSTPYIIHVTQKSSGKMVEQGSTRSFSHGAGRQVGQTSSTQVEQGGGKLVVQCTHEPSLQFLHDYLQRWIRNDHHDSRKVPLLRISIRESYFAQGISHDTLVIEPYGAEQQERGVEANPTTVLALIENILGYKRRPPIHAGFWEFYRDTPFK